MDMFMIGLSCFIVGFACGAMLLSLMVLSGHDDRCRDCIAYQEMMKNIVDEENLEENSGEIKETN